MWDREFCAGASLTPARCTAAPSRCRFAAGQRAQPAPAALEFRAQLQTHPQRGRCFSPWAWGTGTSLGWLIHSTSSPAQQRRGSLRAQGRGTKMVLNSQLPVLLLLLGVIHLPAHTNSGQGCPFPAPGPPPVTSQPRLCRQKGEGGGDRSSPRGQAQFPKARVSSLGLQNFPVPPVTKDPRLAKERGLGNRRENKQMGKKNHT